MAKLRLTRDDALNYWLKKFHKTSIPEVIKEHPTQIKSPEWFKLYPVTQEQHDEWYEWLISEVSKQLRISKKRAKARLSFDYLNCAPYINEESKNVN